MDLEEKNPRLEKSLLFVSLHKYRAARETTVVPSATGFCIIRSPQPGEDPLAELRRRNRHRLLSRRACLAKTRRRRPSLCASASAPSAIAPTPSTSPRCVTLRPRTEDRRACPLAVEAIVGVRAGVVFIISDYIQVAYLSQGNKGRFTAIRNTFQQSLGLHRLQSAACYSQEGQRLMRRGHYPCV